MRNVYMKACAKINLTLDVLGKRSDGYHELSSVMQSIALYDTLLISKTNRQGIELKTDCPALPVDEDNLIYRAAQLLLSEYKIKQGISIELHKKIPLAAGLAGGSSDCAATLLGLNDLFELDIPQKELFELGQRLGADVPFCIMSGTALAEGVGEKLAPLPPHPKTWIVLARLPILVSTKEIFLRWSREAACYPRSSAMMEALKTGDINEIAVNLGNGLTPVATALHPEINTLIVAFQDQNAVGVNMTGSGPTVFAYFSTEFAAFKAIEYIKKQLPSCELFNLKI